MKIYLVGGAVRDELLGLKPKERDWVVVGASVTEMLKQGYHQVGKDFPVFLHPETKEEYALARTERKVGRGYTGFEFDTSSEVTLEEDLMRRDLTINAIAKTSEGDLIDPYQGALDLSQKILRHVSDAFVEDPVRILRIARFAARFVDFQIAPETLLLMQQMVESGEVDALVPERVWKEWERALSEKKPERFFEVLKECGALKTLFPDISVDSLARAAKKTNDVLIRFASLFRGISESSLTSIAEHYRVPTDYRDLAILVVRHFEELRALKNPTAKTILNLLLSLDAFRRESRFKLFLETCHVLDASSSLLKKCYEAAKTVEAKAFLAAGFSGKAIAEEMNAARLRKIEECLQE